MSLDVTIPQIGESVATVFISQFLAKPGDYVQAGDPVVELDSDKASMEVPAPALGKILELLAEEGDEVDVGSVILRIDETAEDEGGSSDAKDDGSGDDDGGSDEDASSEDDDGSSEDDDASDEEASASKDTSKDEDTSADSASSGGSGSGKAGPAARAAAREQGVDLASVKGTGKGGRVTSADVARAKTPQPPADGGGSSKPAAPAGDRTTRVKMSPLRRTIARRLVEAQQTAAMLTTFNEVDMTAIMELRKRYKQPFIDRHEIKLGFMSFFVKAVIEGLKDFPAVNGEIDGNEIIYKHYYNIGVAVSGPKGLVVPVLRDADQLSLAGVEKGIGELAVKARDNKLSMADFEDGTFTISNGGIFGSMMSTPILNPPQVGILGMHNIVERPMVVDGEITIRPMMYLALSYDHRVIDGREAVSFLVRVKQCLEDPERILLEV